MAEQELAWLASHKEQIAALGEDPNLVKALERELQRSASKARPAPPSYDANQLRLGDDFAARVLPSDAARPPASVWLDTAPPPRAAPRVDNWTRPEPPRAKHEFCLQMSLWLQTADIIFLENSHNHFHMQHLDSEGADADAL